MVVKKIVNYWQLNPTQPNPWMNQTDGHVWCACL